MNAAHGDLVNELAAKARDLGLVARTEVPLGSFRPWGRCNFGRIDLLVWTPELVPALLIEVKSRPVKTTTMLLEQVQRYSTLAGTAFEPYVVAPEFIGSAAQRLFDAEIVPCSPAEMDECLQRVARYGTSSPLWFFDKKGAA